MTLTANPVCKYLFTFIIRKELKLFFKNLRSFDANVKQSQIILFSPVEYR